MRSEKRRLTALANAINPAGSLQAKLAKLTDDQRQIYDHWCNQTDLWHRDHPGAAAYERMLNGDSGPQLPTSVAGALFGPTPIITADMTDADAADVYGQLLRGD